MQIRRLIVVAIALVLTVTGAGMAQAGTGKGSANAPGQADKIDADGNGIPDEGVTVTGNYNSLYAYDDAGGWFWDLGDGRVLGNVASVDDLDEATLTTCDYRVHYRGNFENDPFLDSGSVSNMVRCRGFDDNGNYHYQIVHETDPRYRGIPEHAIWGSWEYHVNVESGVGNLARPQKHVG